MQMHHLPQCTGAGQSVVDAGATGLRTAAGAATTAVTAPVTATQALAHGTTDVTVGALEAPADVARAVVHGAADVAAGVLEAPINMAEGLAKGAAGMAGGEGLGGAGLDGDERSYRLHTGWGGKAR